MQVKKRYVTAAFTLALGAQPAQALFLDASGHYSLLGETLVKPGQTPANANYRAIRQGFRLETEARLNDKASFFVEFGLFADPRQAYLGDTRSCAPNIAEEDGSVTDSSDASCTSELSTDTSPRYESLVPRIREAYVRYAFEYCVLEAGRRDRHWGLGIYLNSGDGPFDTDASVFEGIECSLSIQKAQSLGFSIGYDKLSETDNTFGTSESSAFGATRADDTDQIYGMLVFDDRKTNAGQSFTKNIGIYAAYILSSREVSLDNGERQDASTDIKIFDLYTAFYYSSLSFKNEILFRLGESADPGFTRLGGAAYNEGGQVTKNDVQSLAIAGELEWVVSQSGNYTGPKSFGLGNLESHSTFFQYAIAPGDSDGYYGRADESAGANVGLARRDGKTAAVAFHQNFKPAMILFNTPPSIDRDRRYQVDGAFQPNRVLNAMSLGLGYRYQSLKNGHLEAKLVYASLLEGIPNEVKEAFENAPEKLPGHYGDQLGFELGVTYNAEIEDNVTLGVGLAAALPGKAWQLREDQDPSASYLGRLAFAYAF